MEQDRFKFLRISLGVVILLDIIVWVSILLPPQLNNEIYFLDIGQGDSSLVLIDGVKILIDGGPMGGGLQDNLDRVLGDDRYIDLIAISHPQLDHFGGLIGVVKNYKVGAVITSDADSNNSAWQEFKYILKEKEIPKIILSQGDTISYLENKFIILSPEKGSWVKDINDKSLVMLLESEGIKSLFTGDIARETEKRLISLYDLNIDILKVAHHGSKYSSDNSFINEATPAISVIEVGKNSYGHPTSRVLNGLADIGSKIYRTDKDGLIKLIIDDSKIRVYIQK